MAQLRKQRTQPLQLVVVRTGFNEAVGAGWLIRNACDGNDVRPYCDLLKKFDYFTNLPLHRWAVFQQKVI